MKADDLKSRIRFEVQEVGTDTIITGTLKVSAMACCNQNQFNARTQKNLEEHLQETIMRRIYDDQRHELMDALMELLRCEPLDYRAMDAARKRLLDAAKFQDWKGCPDDPRPVP